jgi:hypothetical protein
MKAVDTLFYPLAVLRFLSPDFSAWNYFRDECALLSAHHPSPEDCASFRSVDTNIPVSMADPGVPQ